MAKVQSFSCNYLKGLTKLRTVPCAANKQTAHKQTKYIFINIFVPNIFFSNTLLKQKNIYTLRI